jgi:hypothetical protein
MSSTLQVQNNNKAPSIIGKKRRVRGTPSKVMMVNAKSPSQDALGPAPRMLPPGYGLGDAMAKMDFYDKQFFEFCKFLMALMARILQFTMLQPFAC